jgi:hypothetical protein
METLNLHLAQHAHTATSADAHPRRRASQASRNGVPLSAHVVLRRATLQDAAAIARLAALDSAPVPDGAVLIAVVDGHIAAALPFDGGRAIADPFLRTAHLVELLQLRLGVLDAPAQPRRPLRLRLRALRAAA